MPRTNAADVIAASGTVLDETAVTPFVNDASLLVDGRLADKGLSSGVLTAIEKWVAAHYVAARDETLRIEREKTGQSDVALEERDRFIRRAAALDPTGTIAEIFDLDDKQAAFFGVAKTTRGERYGNFP